MENNLAINSTNWRKIEFQRIKVSNLLAHPVVQREFRKTHGDKLAKNFDWNEYDPIHVSFRNGKYWVIDGQHRLYAIRKNSGGKDVSVLCRVFYGLTEQDEADHFLKSNLIVCNLTTGDKFCVNYRMGDEAIVRMVRGAESAGWTVDFKTHKAIGRITALRALKDCCEMLTDEQYVHMLRALKEAWGSDKDATHRLILTGLTVFYRTYWGQFNERDLVDSLKRISPMTIIRDGDAMKTSTSNNGRGITAGKPYARAILNRYNVKRRSRLLQDII